jgi:hypothetical protein
MLYVFNITTAIHLFFEPFSDGISVISVSTKPPLFLENCQNKQIGFVLSVGSSKILWNVFFERTPLG